MDVNSLSHTKWNCKYHIVFAPKFRRKVAYGQLKQDIANILSTLCRSRDMSRLCSYAGRNTTKYECFKFCGISERKKYIDDI